MLTLEGRSEGTTTTLSLVGELDVATAEWLRGELEPREVSGARLVLDVRRLSFIDSIGVAELLRARMRAEENRHALEILAGDGPARHRLRILGLEAHLGVR